MTVTGLSVTVRCHAKLNLGLEVVRRRADGYHDLVTLFHSVSLADTLQVGLGGDEVTVVCDCEAPSGTGNICYRAAQAFRAAEGVEAGVALRLEKAIPVGGGMGGGSADAAGALLALQQLTGKGTAESLRHLAAGLGADVPYFLVGGTCLGRGVGDQLAPVPVPCTLWFVLCRPDLAVDTAHAYRWLNAADFSTGGATERLARALSEGDLARAGSLLQNAFFPHLCATKPVYLALESSLLQAGALGASLTGSGACVFGLFADQEAAEGAREALPPSAVWSAVACSAQPAVEVCRGD